MFMELLWVFHECSSLFLMLLPRTKRFGDLIQSFELFNKVFVIRYFIYLLMINILMLVKNFVNILDIWL